MSQAMITNASGSQNILSSQKVLDISDKIYLLEPSAAPLYVLVSKLNKRVAINTSFSWIEDYLNPSWDTLSASATSAATAISVNYPAFFNKYDLLKVPSTGEVLLLTAASTSGALTAVRGYGSTSAASAANAADIFRIGTAFEEGSAYSSLVTKSTKASSVTNYAQIFRTSVEITRTLANTELYGGADRAYQRKKKGIEFMRDLERAFLYGEPYEDTNSKDTSITHARRVTGGINYFISTNSTAAGGTLTESEFEGFLRTVFRYGSDTRYMLCAPILISVVSQWAQGKLQMFPKDKTYGIAITQYLSPHGTVNLVKDIMLENAGGVSSTDYYGGYGFAVELSEIVYRFLQNRDVTMETDIQLPGDDTYKDQYICEVGCEFHQEKMHGKLTGVTG